MLQMVLKHLNAQNQIYPCARDLVREERGGSLSVKFEKGWPSISEKFIRCWEKSLFKGSGKGLELSP